MCAFWSFVKLRDKERGWYNSVEVCQTCGKDTGTFPSCLLPGVQYAGRRDRQAGSATPSPGTAVSKDAGDKQAQIFVLSRSESGAAQPNKDTFENAVSDRNKLDLIVNLAAYVLVLAGGISLMGSRYSCFLDTVATSK